MKSRLILLLATLLMLSSCSKDDDDSAAKKLIIGKWVYLYPGLYSDHRFYIFREDGTGASGLYNIHGAISPNPIVSTFRYVIRGGKIAFCNDDEPIKPGEDCFVDYYPLRVTTKTLDMVFGLPHNTYTRYDKWSHAGLPDDLLPQ